MVDGRVCGRLTNTTHKMLWCTVSIHKKTKWGKFGEQLGVEWFKQTTQRKKFKMLDGFKDKECLSIT
jgi:hypothetical protein